MTKWGLTIMIATGGTGGHIYPALTLAHQFKKDGNKVIIVGTGNDIEKKIFAKEEFEVRYFKSELQNYPIYKKLFLLFRVNEDLEEFIRDTKPDLILGMGGYASAQVCVSGERESCVIIHEQNAIAGRVNRLLLFLKARAAIEGLPGAFNWFEKLYMYFFGSHAYYGNPVREKIAHDAWMHRKSNGRYLDSKAKNYPKELRILVMGGSQGARSINRIVPEALAKANEKIDIQVLHVTGEDDYEHVKDLYARSDIDAKIKRYYPEIENAYASSDLFIGRSGAMTVTELSALGLPSILIPYPYAMDNHQLFNARFLEMKGGAIIINNEDLTKELLAEKVIILGRDPENLSKMSESANETSFRFSSELIAKYCYQTIFFEKALRSYGFWYSWFYPFLRVKERMEHAKKQSNIEKL